MPAERPTLLLAGNGFIGRAIARHLAKSGHRVTVHHTGRQAPPAVPGIEELVVQPGPLPITRFPEEAIRAAEHGVAVHMQCMGAPDGRAFVRVFDGVAERLVLISSCDVYRAYGRFIRTEPGPSGPTPITEEASLREVLYPYRGQAADAKHLLHWYDKLDAERALR